MDADPRYEAARTLYVEGDRDGEDCDDTYNRRTKSALAMWLLGKGEDAAAGRVLESIDPPAKA